MSAGTIASWVMAVCAALTFLGGIGVFMWRRELKIHDAMHAAITPIREQVQNSHDTNLRDDIDGIRDLLNEVRAEQTKQATAQAVTTAEVKGLRRDVERLEDRLNRA